MGPGRIALIAALAIVVVAAGLQIVLPGMAAGRVEDRLTEDGGSADVSISSLPAARLLWEDGDRLEVTGQGLRFDIDDRIDDPLGRLDGFDEVDIRLTDVTAEPVAVALFELTRGDHGDAFSVLIRGEAVPAELGAQLGRESGGALGGLIGSFGGSMLGSDPLPVEVEGRVRRNGDGTIDVDTAAASIGGLPAGPFATLVVQSVLDRL